MTTNTQTRPSIAQQTVQQFNATSMATVLSWQIQSFTAAGRLAAVKDLAVCDATAGTFIVTLPSSAEVLLGKPYLVKEISGANNVTITAGGAPNLIDGSATQALAAGEAMLLVARSVTAAGAVLWSIVGQTAPNPAAGGELLAANNLSELTATQLTARANIGANRLDLAVGRLDLIAANGDVLRYVHRGPSMTLQVIDSAITAALATANATITAAINGTPVTGGVVTITEAGSAAGDLDTAAPSAANVLAAGDVLTLTVGGGNTGASFADVSIHGIY